MTDEVLGIAAPLLDDAVVVEITELDAEVDVGSRVATSKTLIMSRSIKLFVFP